MVRTIRLLFFFAATTFASPMAWGGNVASQVDAESRWVVYTLKQENTIVKVAPNAGFNAFSMIVDDVELFHQAAKVKQIPGVHCGNPILYPTPNRVRDGGFVYEGKAYRFQPAGQGNHIHGLVNRLPWEVTEVAADSTGASITASVHFVKGSEPFRLFPFPHSLKMTIRVEASRVRWTYVVDNQKGNRGVPFGIGFHPYFRDLNNRDSTRLTIPASHLLESVNKLPTGNLLNLDGHRLDARSGVRLDGYRADHVFVGMTPNAPATIEFSKARKRLSLHTSKEFTHVVVWTPDRPFFSVENQTCATDAHNLAAGGMNDVAHLQICPAGKSLTGYVEYEVQNME